MRTGQPESDTLRRILEEAPSLTAAAKQLGVSRPTLYRWMRVADLDVVRRHTVNLPRHTGDLDGDGSAA